ncbi:hypothetical protein GMORB2_2894 [Geosmithia morbida]|uniref:PH domain-containing protein n=1 Tax=Geosmithia morbida TaxID=1094350 RepID=A0A9P4YNY9_9HYPO|nr:uncharacterized protein GMORB2_2894 [Geosmithia morbida]KAF4120456.1 hypothetical protein GMORB2_2894 [Geosmithia morbida]
MAAPPAGILTPEQSPPQATGIKMQYYDCYNGDSPDAQPPSQPGPGAERQASAPLRRPSTAAEAVLSRYRSFRDKSISPTTQRIKDFDIFRDHHHQQQQQQQSPSRPQTRQSHQSQLQTEPRPQTPQEQTQPQRSRPQQLFTPTHSPTRIRSLSTDAHVAASSSSSHDAVSSGTSITRPTTAGAAAAVVPPNTNSNARKDRTATAAAAAAPVAAAPAPAPKEAACGGSAAQDNTDLNPPNWPPHQQAATTTTTTTTTSTARKFSVLTPKSTNIFSDLRKKSRGGEDNKIRKKRPSAGPAGDLDRNLPLTPPSSSHRQRPTTTATAANREHASSVIPWAEEVARLKAEKEQGDGDGDDDDNNNRNSKRRTSFQDDHHRQQATPTATPSPKSRSRKLFGFLKRTNTNRAAPDADSRLTTPRDAQSKAIDSDIENKRPSTSASEVSSLGPSIMDFDVPTTASNGGERRVTVRCQSSTISLPVYNDTTPMDIVRETANRVVHALDPTTATVYECYEVLGLERRMRQYEHVRDAMNSWDRDRQNSLLIIGHSARQPDDADLEADSVPRTEEPPPVGFTVHMHHSSRPGKWNKRYITLMDNGQMVASKKMEGSGADRDTTTLCHLSDFDIYLPRENQTRRHLKPPRDFCYAIKSQQKTALFPNGDNFVHFFSTDDEDLARRFYDAVHAWRSWYLAVRVHGILDDSDSGDSALSFKVSDDKPPYLDLKQISEAAAARVERQKLEEEQQKQKQHKLQQQQQQQQQQQPANTTLLGNLYGEGEFLAGGLLGDSYDKRKQEADGVGIARKPVAANDGPFTDGPSLLNSAYQQQADGGRKPEPSTPWFPSALEHSAREQSSRTRSMSRPEQPTRRPTTAGAPLVRRGTTNTARPPHYGGAGAHASSEQHPRALGRARTIGLGIPPPASRQAAQPVHGRRSAAAAYTPGAAALRQAAQEYRVDGRVVREAAQAAGVYSSRAAD